MKAQWLVGFTLFWAPILLFTGGFLWLLWPISAIALSFALAFTATLQFGEHLMETSNKEPP